jgi:hypothetical protein
MKVGVNVIIPENRGGIRWRIVRRAIAIPCFGNPARV